MSTQLNLFSPVVIVGTLLGLVILAIGWFWLVRLFASVVEGPLNPSNESVAQVHVDTSPALASVTGQQSLAHGQTTTTPSSVLLPMLSEQKANQDKHSLLDVPQTASHIVETTAGTLPVTEDTKAPASSLSKGTTVATTALAPTGATALATASAATTETATTVLPKQRPWQLRQPLPLRRRQPLGKQTIHSLRIRG